MVDLDLDIIAGKKKTIKLGGQEYELKDLTVAEHLDNEVLAGQIDNMPLVDLESVKDAVVHIKKYIMKKYIPLINKFVNYYLDMLESPYNIMFNDEIEKSILGIIIKDEKLRHNLMKLSEDDFNNLNQKIFKALKWMYERKREIHL